MLSLKAVAFAIMASSSLVTAHPGPNFYHPYNPYSPYGGQSTCSTSYYRTTTVDSYPSVYYTTKSATVPYTHPVVLPTYSLVPCDVASTSISYKVEPVLVTKSSTTVVTYVETAYSTAEYPVTVTTTSTKTVPTSYTTQATDYSTSTAVYPVTTQAVVTKTIPTSKVVCTTSTKGSYYGGKQ